MLFDRGSIIEPDAALKIETIPIRPVDQDEQQKSRGYRKNKRYDDALFVGDTLMNSMRICDSQSVCTPALQGNR